MAMLFTPNYVGEASILNFGWQSHHTVAQNRLLRMTTYLSNCFLGTTENELNTVSDCGDAFRHGNSYPVTDVI